jgi:haloacetate dehalogenase
VIGAAPEALLDYVFATRTPDPEAIDPGAREAYSEAMTADTIAAMCGDYRASFHLDREHDADDRAAGRRIAAPVLVISGESETQLGDAPDVWRAWADDVTGARVPGGHFVPEEAPRELVGLLRPFLAAG